MDLHVFSCQRNPRGRVCAFRAMTKVRRTPGGERRESNPELETYCHENCCERPAALMRSQPCMRSGTGTPGSGRPDGSGTQKLGGRGRRLRCRAGPRRSHPRRRTWLGDAFSWPRSAHHSPHHVPALLSTCTALRRSLPRLPSTATLLVFTQLPKWPTLPPLPLILRRLTP